MKDTENDEAGQDSDVQQGPPAWVTEPSAPPAAAVPRREPRLPRAPVPGSHQDDGLWTHVLETGGLLTVATWVAAVAIPHPVSLWMITLTGAAITAAAWFTSLSQTDSLPMANYLAAWGTVLTGWITVARIESPWNKNVIFGLVLPAAILSMTGVSVIRRHRDKMTRAANLGRDTASSREARFWEKLLPRFGVTGVDVRDVVKTEGGKQIWCRLGKYNADGRKPTGIEGIRELAGALPEHLRLQKGSVYIQENPPGHTSADFVIHVRTVTGPRLARWLPADNRVISINRAFGLGVMDTGKEFTLRLRELVVFICGVRGSGKSTLLNVFIAQLCRTPDALIFVIDLKGGQEARAWLMPWLLGQTDRPVIDWLATTREEADIMLDALLRAGQARSESGRHKRKLRPSIEFPAIVVICDETAVMTGHGIREDGISNTQLSVKLLRIAETFRSVAIDPVIAAVRAVVDTTGNSGIKAQAEAKIGMKVATIGEGQSIFPDDYPAAKQLAELTDKGSGIPKIGAELYPPVHFYNIADGDLDDDGHPTEDRITPIVLATTRRRPMPEQDIRDAMGDAYAQRWDRPHIKELCAAWIAAEGRQPPAEKSAPAASQGSARRGSSGGDDDFEDLWRNDPLLRDLGDPGTLNSGYDEDRDEPGRRINPARKRMYELLLGRGLSGWKVDDLWHKMALDGHEVARQTVHAWLSEAEQLGWVYRTGKPRSKWVWRLAEGDEYGIPGWD